MMNSTLNNYSVQLFGRYAHRMPMPFRTTLVLVPLVLATVAVGASGPVGIYGIVERVVLEPNDNAPERLQVWGAFAYADGRSTSGLSASPARRGYLYFRLPDPGDPMRDVVGWPDLGRRTHSAR